MDTATSPDQTTQSRVPLIIAVSLFTLVIIRTAWVCDDAYITQRTVWNLIHGFGARWNVAERVQTYTHPLWMILLTAVELLTRESYFTTIVVSDVRSQPSG